MSNLPDKSEILGAELCVHYTPITLLKINPRNARKHPKSQVSQIALSIGSFGNNVPILIDKNMNVICGHGRLLACQQLGLQNVPTILLDHLTKAQADAFAIADNRLTEIAEWDDRTLAETFHELSAQNLNFNIEATGFSLDEIEMRIESLSDEQKPDPADRLPEISEEVAISRLGDLWLLGNHRLLCGDATKPDDINRLMDGKRAAVTFTDAPYGVNYGK